MQSDRLIKEGEMKKHFFLCVLSLTVMLFFAPFGFSETVILKPSEVQELLAQGKYQELDEKLTAMQKDFENGNVTEDDVYLLFTRSNLLTSDFENHLNQWIAAFPNSYSAYLARGVYFQELGSKRRGGKFFNETSQAQVGAMEFYFEKAIKDLNTALELNPRLVPAYCSLIIINMHSSAKNSIKKITDEGLQNLPESMLIRWFYLLSLEPKWGGSFDEMESFIKEIRPYYERNPKLMVFEGRVSVARGDQLSNRGQYDAAIPFYDKGLSHGENNFYLKQRGEAYLRLNQCEKAIPDLDRSVELWPPTLSTLELRAYCYMKTNQCTKALKDYEAILAVDPVYPNIDLNVKYCRKRVSN